MLIIGNIENYGSCTFPMLGKVRRASAFANSISWRRQNLLEPLKHLETHHCIEGYDCYDVLDFDPYRNRFGPYRTHLGLHHVACPRVFHGCTPWHTFLLFLGGGLDCFLSALSAKRSYRSCTPKFADCS